MADYAARVPENGWIVEVGTFCGRSAFVLAANSDPSVKVTCIDPWWFDHGDRYVAEHYQNTLGNRDCYYSLENCSKNLAQFGDRVELVKATSPYFHPRFTEQKADMFFIDGDHSGEVVKKELKLYYNNLAENGTIVVDDYQHYKYADMTREVQNFVLSYGIELNILKQSENDSHLAVIEK